MRRRLRTRLALPLLALALLGAEADGPGGFALGNASVPRSAIVAGGPGRDGIRSVDAPEFASLDEATWVDPDTPVLGVALGDEARAYPVHLLEWHQVVNDVLAGVPIAVTYDPLAGTPRVYRRSVAGRTLRFGVSGLLYNSNFLLYDRETESLWSQFRGDAIAGAQVGAKLVGETVRQEVLAAWLARHPGSRILARPEPERIDYRYSPYRVYWVKDEIPFPVSAEDRRYHAKEMALGVVVDGRARAYLGSIATREEGRIEDDFQGKRIRARYDSEHAVFTWDVPEGVEVTEAYWFAWKAFHPDTEIWRDEEPSGR